MAANDNPDCPFCRIVRQQDPDVREVYRDDQVVAFFPTEPATLGHTLVIPHRHIPDIWALDEETAAQLASATIRVSQGVKSAFTPEGLNVIQSNGSAASQTVPHLHVHVVPRWRDDPMGNIWPETAYPDNEKSSACERLRKALGGPLTPSPPPVDADDHRKHLEFIQAIVTRMSSASSTAKGWLLPVITAAYGYALVKEARAVALLGVMAVLLFALLDANYLNQEKAYRRLYDIVTREPHRVPRFSLNPAHANAIAPDHACWCENLKRFIARWLPGKSVWLSWSIAPFYGAFTIVGLFIYWHTPSPPPSPPPTQPATTHATPH
ncbi:HIT family protein [Mycobacterium marseillense]|uniref:HIT family protein n=1 Tax=Mycobacterium marseillense TaxID=701042 RepID=UPI000A6955D5|nr:HIT family protein [Mycobacterium marseillense]